MALDGARENRLRPAFRRFRAIERRENGGNIVPVDHFRGETFGFELLAIRLHVVLVHRGLALAERVDVRDHGQVVELVVAGEFGCFPDLSFGHFAVAEQDVNARVALIHARADREARANGKSLAERAGGRVDAVNARRGMAFELAREFAQRHHARNGKHSRFRERGVEHGRRVALREHEAVVVVRIRILGIELHGVEKYSGHELRGGHAGSRMARSGGRGGHHRINTQKARFLFDGFNCGLRRPCGGSSAHSRLLENS